MKSIPRARRWWEWAVLVTGLGVLWVSMTSWAIAGGCDEWCQEERRSATQALQDDLFILQTQPHRSRSSSWALTDALLQLERLQRIEREAEAQRKREAEMESIYKAFEGRGWSEGWPTK